MGNNEGRLAGLMPGILLKGPLSATDLFMGEEIAGYAEGYNLGDLLHAPRLRTHYDQERWDARGNLKSEARALVAAQPPDSILARYVALHHHGNPFPNGPTLREALEGYFAALNDEGIVSVAEEATKETTLCVHARVGDKNRPLPVDILGKMAAKFESVIVFAGLHAWHADGLDEHKSLSAARLNELLDLNDNIRVVLQGSPDDHLCVMARARHLLLSWGGFSSLAGIVCRATIYVPPQFQKKFDSKRWRREMHRDASVKPTTPPTRRRWSIGRMLLGARW